MPKDSKYPHLLEINEADFPEKFQPILRRLHEAAQDPSVREAMELEDDFYAEIQAYEQLIAEERAQKEQERQQKKAAIHWLLQLGVPIDAIAQRLALSPEEFFELTGDTSKYPPLEGR